jgi:predicted DsbA family dithiol-disulfide isomerase
MFDAAGLPHAERLDLVPNSRRALALAEHARDNGRHDDVHERLMRAYWVEGRDIGSDDVLLSVAEEAGLDRGEAAAALGSPELLGRIEAETTRALESGASGVPAWAVDDAILVPGAQPHELFERVMERLGHEPVDG